MMKVLVINCSPQDLSWFQFIIELLQLERQLSGFQDWYMSHDSSVKATHCTYHHQNTMLIWKYQGMGIVKLLLANQLGLCCSRNAISFYFGYMWCKHILGSFHDLQCWFTNMSKYVKPRAILLFILDFWSKSLLYHSYHWYP